MAYFESVGFSPAFPMNPADFLLDLANGTFSFKIQLLNFHLRSVCTNTIINLNHYMIELTEYFYYMTYDSRFIFNLRESILTRID